MAADSRPGDFRFLVNCISPARNPHDLVAQAAEANWINVVADAEVHGVRPLLLRTLREFPAIPCAPEARNHLEAAAAEFTRRNLVHTSEMLRALTRFREAHIDAACFKGPAVAQAVYGSVAMREFLDVDLIVPRKSFRQAADILGQCGYTTRTSSREQREAFESAGAQVEFRNPSTRTTIDLHWEFTPLGAPFPLDADEIWARTVNGDVAGHAVRTLCPDDMMLFLAAHGTKEGWRQLKWTADFVYFGAQQRNLNWESIFERARAKGCIRALLVGFRLAEELFHVTPFECPERLQFVAERHRKAVELLTRQAVHRMINFPKRRVAQGGAREFLDRLNFHDRFLDRARIVARIAATRTPADYSGLPLPRYLWLVYYLTRIFRLSSKGVSALLKTARS